MGVLDYAKHAAFFHELFDLDEDALADFFGQRQERQAANDITHLAQARARVDRIRIAGIAADDVEIGESSVESSDEVVVQLNTEVRAPIGDDLFKVFCYCSGADAKLENDVLLIRLDPREHLGRKLGRARCYRPDLKRIFQKRLQELEILIHLEMAILLPRRQSRYFGMG